MNTRQSGKSADCGWIRPLLHRGSGGSPRATQLFGCSLMSDLTKLEQYLVMVDRLVQIAEKDDLAECARLLAMNVAPL